MTRRRHSMPFGAEIRADGLVRFALWAPSQASISVEIDGATLEPMLKLPGGWHQLITGKAASGSRYRFALPDGSRVPDPASRYQPDDVHGASQVIDPYTYEWRDDGWRGRRWEEAVMYELHIGAFTPEGTFAGATRKLDHLLALGVTAIELMPIGDFPGRRDWGYDGVQPFAPDAAYGTPDDLKRLVDEAHARGIMILLDVVYNHFGPEGYYGAVVSPEMFTSARKTPWGDAINLDPVCCTPVREYFIENALYWIKEFHMDGLRVDAAHAIHDDSPQHLLQELAERVHAASAGRDVHLILENDENEAVLLTRENGYPRWYTAQWNDDVHHALHVAATGESCGYYGDYFGEAGRLGRALAEGFAFQGEWMAFRAGLRGQPSARLPPQAFIAFIQNHDQTGNRPFGERLTAFAPQQAIRAVAAVYLLLPQVPLLFMGEEWAAEQPFPFFCDFPPELAAAVRKGRCEEFAQFAEFRDSISRREIPDPVADRTFASAKLSWDDIVGEPHAGWLNWYKQIIAVRHREVIPRLSEITRGGTYAVVGPGAVVVRWDAGGHANLVLEANLSRSEMRFPQSRLDHAIWREGECANGRLFGPFSVRWSIENALEAHRNPP